MPVGNISSFDSLTNRHGISGTLHRANVVTGGDDFTFSIGRDVTVTWTFGTGAGKVNQIVEVIFTATKNTTTNLDLSGVLTNRIGDTVSTFTLVKFFKMEYLTTAQDATNGNASTGTITIEPAVANPITTSPLGAAQQFILNPGAFFEWCDPLNGFTVTGGSADSFKLTHSDNNLDGILRLTIFGEK